MDNSLISSEINDSWKGLSLDLLILLDIVKNGKFQERKTKDSVYYGITNRFSECLDILIAKANGNEDIDMQRILLYGINHDGIHTEISYIDVSNKLISYCTFDEQAIKQNLNYPELLSALEQTTKGILKGKVVGNHDLFRNISTYLGKMPHPNEYQNFNEYVKEAEKLSGN